VSDCCLANNLSAISSREQVTFQSEDDDVCFVLSKQTRLAGFV